MSGKHRIIWSVCECCKRPYQATATEILTKGRKFCGTSCSIAGRKRVTSTGLFAEKNPNWKGGRTYHSKGYIYAKAPDHPRAWNGYVLEHILVAEEKLGRYLKEGETVHHKNEVKDDNSPDNIEVYATPGEHTSIHTRDYYRDEKGRFISKDAVAV